MKCGKMGIADKKTNCRCQWTRNYREVGIVAYACNASAQEVGLNLLEKILTGQVNARRSRMM